ncbi:MAG TPA: mannose-1-phosphate guanylyltransferase/mannose-6-phosphate isomerase [Candidatus Binatia bacterium]|nr:mannose-1-phosphate guanylyltransferase/mannose-6-phosphate isomerase [Candidatus Binatia bacterium]
MTLIVPVVLCGGSGTRLWPLSRALQPKQLLALTGERTMLQETVLRAHDPSRYAPPIVICGEDHRFIVAEQLRQIGVVPEAIIVEPIGRNTAPAAGIVAAHLLSRAPDALMLVMPADHAITDPAAFQSAVTHGRAAADAGRLVTFGIEPTRPETGYGYLQRGNPIDGLPRCFALTRFVEKPPRATAEQFLADGDHLWNSGIFLFPVERFQQELTRHEPAVVAACEAALEDVVRDTTFLRLGEAFRDAPSCAIDTAVMERVADSAVVPVTMGWSDVGSWAALWEVRPKDAHGNAVAGEVIAIDVEGSLLRSEGPAIAAVGLRDVAVVATRDAVLVMAKDRGEDIRAIVQRFEQALQPRTHTIVQEPWGASEIVDRGDAFVVRRLTIHPGAEMPAPEGAHWVVVQGSGRVARHGRSVAVAAGNDVEPGDAFTQVVNDGTEPLVLVEVRTSV